MEHLWAPWRNDYVGTLCEGSVAKEDLFFSIGQSANDDETHVVLRSKSCFALLNLFPYNTAHHLIIPYRKVAELSELSLDEQADLWATVQRVMDAVRKLYHPHGFNIGLNIGAAAGAGIPEHLHVHLVPRWNGDANFLTTIAGTRVHPSDLTTVYQTMKKELSLVP
ncbi:MAG: HIT domain-containing protein [Blastochloris sp.]|nr:HIT domain-containing protein [Blastochloris sp.]